MSSCGLRRTLCLLRTGRHPLPLFPKYVTNALPSNRQSSLGEACISPRKVQHNCPLGCAPSGERGASRSLVCIYHANVYEKVSLHRWLWWPHTAPESLIRVYTSLCALGRRTQSWVNPRRTQCYVGPPAVCPRETAEGAARQFKRSKSTQRGKSGGALGDKKLLDTSKSATARKSVGETQQGTRKKKVGNLLDEGTPSVRSAGAEDVPRSPSVREASTEPDKKKRRRRSGTDGAAKQEKPVSEIPASPALQKSTAGSISIAQERPRKSADAQKASRSSSVQKENAEPDKKTRCRNPAAEGEKKAENTAPNVPVAPESLFRFRYSRSSKPGGSSANKSETKVALHVPLKALEAYYGVPMDKLADDPRAKVNKKGELIITSEKHASQALNKKECMQKLDDMLMSLQEFYIAEEQKAPYVIDEETQKKYKFNILVRKKKDQYQRKCNQVSVRDM